MDLNKTASQNKPMAEKPEVKIDTSKNPEASFESIAKPPIEPLKKSFNFKNKKVLFLIFGFIFLAGLAFAVYQLSKLPEVYVGLGEYCDDVYPCDSPLCCIDNECQECPYSPLPSYSPLPPVCDECSDMYLVPDPGCTADPLCTSSVQDGKCCQTPGGEAKFCCYKDCRCYTGGQYGCEDVGNGCIRNNNDIAITTQVIICDCTDYPTCPCSANCQALPDLVTLNPGETFCPLAADQCGQVDAVGLCGSCKNSGCVPQSPPPSEAPSPSPSSSPSPSPSTPPPTCTTVGAITPTDQGTNTLIRVTDDINYQNVELRVIDTTSTSTAYGSPTTCGTSCWEWTVPIELSNISRIEFWVNVPTPGSGQNGESCGSWTAPLLQCTSLDYYLINGVTPSLGQTPLVGDNVNFICESQSNPTDYVADYFEFQYQVDGKTAYLPINASTPSCDTSTGVCTSVSDTINISIDGYYIVQCRVCKNTGACTPWGQTN